MKLTNLLPTRHILPGMLLQLLRICINPFTFALFLILLFSGVIHAQGITINPRSKLVMNGGVSLVVNSAQLKNNGTFSEGLGTVKFSGYSDTSVSNLSGTSSTVFYNLSITKSANSVKLKSAAAVRNILAVTGGNLYTDSNLTLLSNANLTAQVDIVPSYCNIIGKANVERYIPNRRAWRLLTAPLTDANTIYNTWQNRGIYTSGIGTLITGPNPGGGSGNGLDSSTMNQSSMKTYNYATQALTSVLNTKVSISKGSAGSADNTGYFIFIRGDRNPSNISLVACNNTTISSTGRLQTGTQVFPASSAYGGYTLIGNPYASPLDFNLVTRANLMKRFYVWDPRINTLGGYVVLDDLDNDGIFTKSVGASQQTSIIQSSQAFFVQTSSTGAASLTINESNKSSYNNNQVFRPSSPDNPLNLPTESFRMNLFLVEPDSSLILGDGILAEFNDIFSDAVNLDDAPKFTNTNECLGILRYGSTLAVERRPFISLADTLFLKLWKTTQRKYRFEFIPTNLNHPTLTCYLEDKYLNTSTNINLIDSSNIDFTIDANPASIAADRFRVVFRQLPAPLPVTFANVKAYQKAKDISVDWQVQNEINITKYDVEKSTDGSNFTKVNTTTVTGNNNALSNYNWLDIHPVQGNNFYRIKSYDQVGQSKYSVIVKVNIGKLSAGSISVYPNPIKDNTINLQLYDQSAGKYNVKLINNLGQVLYQNSLQYTGGNMVQTINPKTELPSGIYELDITGPDNKNSTQKIIIQ